MRSSVNYEIAEDAESSPDPPPLLTKQLEHQCIGTASSSCHRTYCEYFHLLPSVLLCFVLFNRTLISTQKLCSQTDNHGDSRVPYILYALNRIKFSECWTKSQLLLPLVMDDTLKSYALSKQMFIGDLILPGHIEKCDMYWLKTCKEDSVYISIV